MNWGSMSIIAVFYRVAMMHLCCLVYHKSMCVCLLALCKPPGCVIRMYHHVAWYITKCCVLYSHIFLNKVAEIQSCVVTKIPVVLQSHTVDYFSTAVGKDFESYIYRL